MSEIVLETKKLTKYYGKRLALDHLDMKVQQGTIYGLLGRNGAGKTTAIKLLLGLMKPTSGSGSMLGCDCQELTPAIRQRIGYVTEGHRLFRWMKIGELGKYQKAFFDGDFNESLYDDMLDYFELSKKQKIIIMPSLPVLKTLTSMIPKAFILLINVQNSKTSNYRSLMA